MSEKPDYKPRWLTSEERKRSSCDLQFVYVLRDPSTGKNNEVFYVGRTKHLLERYIAHVKGDNSGSAKDERIRHITRGGRLPIMETVHWACSEKEAIYQEAYYTHYYLAAGVPLTNATLALNNNGYRGREDYEIEKWEERGLKRSWFHRWIRRLLRMDDFPYKK
jgi:predicted GIY-YIG superfamily endonuclease